MSTEDAASAWRPRSKARRRSRSTSPTRAPSRPPATPPVAALGPLAGVGVERRCLDDGALHRPLRGRVRLQPGRQRQGRLPLRPGRGATADLPGERRRDRQHRLDGRQWGAAPYLAHSWPRSSPWSGSPRRWPHELGPSGIRVNCVCPGFVTTSMQERELAWESELRGTSIDAVREHVDRGHPARPPRDARGRRAGRRLPRRAMTPVRHGRGARRERRRLHGLARRPPAPELPASFIHTYAQGWPSLKPASSSGDVRTNPAAR